MLYDRVLVDDGDARIVERMLVQRGEWRKRRRQRRHVEEPRDARRRDACLGAAGGHRVAATPGDQPRRGKQQELREHGAGDLRGDEERDDSAEGRLRDDREHRIQRPEAQPGDGKGREEAGPGAVQQDGGAPGGLRVGGTVGLAWSDAALDVSWQRSARTVDGISVTDDARIGAALSGNVSRRVVLSSQASYHLLFEDVDRAALDLAWRAPWAEAVLSGGIEHRQPWFDASSIFNVFGARPFEGAHLVYQHPLGALRTSLEVRTWGRVYDGDLDLSNFGGGVADARADGRPLLRSPCAP